MRCAGKGEGTTRVVGGVHRGRRCAQARPRPSLAGAHSAPGDRPRRKAGGTKEWCRAVVLRAGRRRGAGQPQRRAASSQCCYSPFCPARRARRRCGHSRRCCSRPSSVQVLLHSLHQSALGHRTNHRIHLLACTSRMGGQERSAGRCRQGQHTRRSVRQAASGPGRGPGAATAANQGRTATADRINRTDCFGTRAPGARPDFALIRTRTHTHPPTHTHTNTHTRARGPPTVLEDHDGGNAADAVLGGHVGALVGVQLELQGRQGPAWTGVDAEIKGRGAVPLAVILT